MPNKPKDILDLEQYYHITLNEVESGIVLKWDNKNYYQLSENGNVIALNLIGNQITDLQPLSGLTGLTELRLSNNQITDLQPLTGLTGLTRLVLNDNQITDLQPLSGLTGLTTLGLYENQIKDLQPLTGLTGLTELRLSKNQIKDLQPLTGLTGLTRLVLNDNQITDLQPLSGLTGLAELRLSKNQITDLQPLSGLTGLAELWLSKNQITDLQPLSGLTGLTELGLNNNQITDLQPLSGLTGLTELWLNDNQIKDLQPLSGLTGLTELGLDYNQITDLQPLSVLTGLTELWLDYNQITDLQPLSVLTGLTELWLSNNQITDLRPLIDHPNFKRYKYNSNPLQYPPKEIAEKGIEEIAKWEEKLMQKTNNIINENLRTESKELDLGFCGITDLSYFPQLFNCTHLETLILSNYYAEFSKGKWHEMPSYNSFYPNNISYFPQEIKKLKNLKKLIVGGDWKKNNEWNRGNLKDITPLLDLSNLEYLNISNNKIEKIPNFTKLSQLRVLHANNNEIKSIYKLPKNSKLEELYLSNNKLEKVDFLINLEQVKAIDLHSNQIKDLANLYDLIDKLGIENEKWKTDTICIANNPLTNPGMEVVQLGKKAVLDQLDENKSADKTFKNNEIKLIFIGNSEVGKTTLANFLKYDIVKDQQYPYTLWMDEFEFTEGIFKEKKIRAFDFGGHDYYHDTHHIFFSNNALYILLWDNMTNTLKQRPLTQKDKEGKEITTKVWDYPLRYWIESVNYIISGKKATNFNFDIDNTSTYNAQMLIVQNKVKSNDSIVFLNNKSLKDNYSFITNFVHIDIHKNINLDYFKSNIKQMMDNAQILGAKYPSYYQIIRDKLSSYDGKAIIKLVDFKTFCKISYPNFDNKYALNVARYLENIGLIVMNKNEELIVMNKKDLTNEITQIFNKLQDQNGHFNYKDLDQKDIQFKDEVISFMKEFKMIFEINKMDQKPQINKENYQNNVDNDNNENNTTSSIFVSPLYLPEEPSAIVSLFIDHNQLPCRRFQYSGFIHKQVILNIFSEYSSKIPVEDSNSYYWRNGLIIKEDEGLILIKFFIGTQEGGAYIDIFTLNNLVSDAFFKTIIDYIIEINKGYEPEEMVTIDGINFVSLKELHNAENNRYNSLIYKGKEFKLFDYKKYLKNKNYMKRIFISYSHQDSEFFNDLLSFIKPLERANQVETWTDLELKSGDELKTILENLNNADIVILLISQNFIASNFIQDHELPLALKKKKENNGEIILVSLDYSTVFDLEIDVKNSLGEIEKIKMKEYYFIPQNEKGDLKPINDWYREGRKAEAWLKIYEDIKSKLN